MSGGEKKYNIWIAYSDLFTNLSTFLFISALGVFAAIGSGLLQPVGWGGAVRCGVPPAADVSRMEPTGLLTRMPARKAELEDCTQYYRIGTFRFETSESRLSDFRAGDVQLTEADVRSRICQPVWLTISRKDFRRRGGRIIFRGVAAIEDKWSDGRRCPPPRARDEPRIDLAGMPAGISHLEVIQRCRETATAHPTVCRKIIDCLPPNRGRGRVCRSVSALLAWDEQATMACHAQWVRQQAYRIYEICERAPADDDFRDDLYDSEAVFVDEARRQEMRGNLWESADYGAFVRRRNQVSQLNSLRAGTVVLEVRYTR